MKKIFLSILSLFFLIVCRSQYTIVQNIGSASTLVRVPANGGLQGGLITRNFTDTATCNSTTQLDAYANAIIQTADGTWWGRNIAATAWVQINGGGGSSVNIYNSNGTITGIRTVNQNDNALSFTNMGGFVVYDDAGSTPRLKITDVETDLYSPDNLSAVIIANSSIKITGLANNTSQDRLVGIINSTGQIGNITIGYGLTMPSGVLKVDSATIFPVIRNTFTFNNGITRTGNTVQLGGALTKNTAVTGLNSFTLELQGAGSNDVTFGDVYTDWYYEVGNQNTNVGIANDGFYVLTNDETGVNKHQSDITTSSTEISTYVSYHGWYPRWFVRSDSTAALSTVESIVDNTGNVGVIGPGNAGTKIFQNGEEIYIKTTRTPSVTGSYKGIEMDLDSYIYIDTLLASPDTTSWKPMVYNNSTKQVRRSTYWPGGGSGSSGITIGTTTITSGTSTRVLFDDGGVVGEDAGFTYDKTTNIITTTAGGVAFELGTGSNRGMKISSTNIVGVDDYGIMLATPISGTNVSGVFAISPKGTGSFGFRSQILLYDADVNATSNYGVLLFRASSAEYFLENAVSGSGTLKPFYIIMDGTLNTATANVVFNTDGTTMFNQKVGIGITPTAYVHIKAGTTTIAPLRFTSGTDLSSPVAGAWYYNGTRLGFSPSTTIKRVALTNDAAPSNGQIPIGNGTDYAAANITSFDGSVTITNGSGTIDLSAAPAGFTIATVSTSNATVTTIATITMGGTYATGYLEATIIGIQDDGTDFIAGQKMVRCYNNNGTAALGTITDIGAATETSGGFAGATWTYTVSTNTVLIRVTGIAATNINWKVSYRYVETSVAL